VTVPRALPTDDVLVLREKKGGEAPGAKKPTAPPREAITGALDLEIVTTPWTPSRKAQGDGYVCVLATLEAVRHLADHPLGRAGLRAVVAPLVTSQAASALAAEGIACFHVEAGSLAALKGVTSLQLPAPAKWSEGVTASAGKSKLELSWLAKGPEAGWVTGGGLRVPPKK
jgi:aconitate hydratase